jgi:threonine dehydrogenase-like Zn-dependent dehydrogenase
MKTTAVRLYGAMDLRTETFELPEIGDDGVRVEVVSDSICMSSYKAAVQGTAHKRVPKDAAENPVIIGHEFCGKIVEVGKNWQEKYRAGEHVAIQPAHFYQGSLLAPGYSYRYCGGDATFVNIPHEILAMDCLLPYHSDTFFYGSLAEPMSCIIGTFQGIYHTSLGSYAHRMGIVEGGKLAMLASVGPMGLGAIDYALHGGRKPALLVVTDIDDARLARASSIYTVEHAKELGVELRYVNTAKLEDPVANLQAITGGTGFDDVICFAPVKPVVEQADAILGFDGCLSFFAGPTNSAFRAEVNFYDVHYSSHHILGTTGGNTDDMREAIALMNAGKINPAAMVTHIGGLNSAAETTMNLPNIPGGKKLIYTHLDLPLTAIADFAESGKNDPLFAELDQIVKSNNGLWCAGAEAYLLSHANRLDETAYLV